jgi:hypothetical protein
MDILGLGTWGSLTVPDYRMELERPDQSAAQNTRQIDNSTHETLVPLGVVVLQTDLQLDGLDEVPLLSDGGSILVLLSLSLEGRLQEQSLDGGSHA